MRFDEVLYFIRQVAMGVISALIIVSTIVILALYIQGLTQGDVTWI